MKKINRIKIWERLRQRFDLSDHIPETPYLAESIQPVVDVSPLLVEAKAQTTATTNTTASDSYVVPAGKRWTIYAAAVSRANAGINTIYAVVSGVTVPLTSSSATSTTWNGYPFQLDTGQSILINANAGTSGSINSYILYTEEDLT